MANRPDVLILGGGVIGLTAAFFLRQQGVRVGVLDRGEFGQESSWAGAGIISSPPDKERAHDPLDQLNALTGELHPRIAEQLRAETGVDNGYLRRGGWELFPPNHHVPILQWRSLGIPFEQAEETTLKDREPSLRPGQHFAYFLPRTAQVRNPRHLKALLAWCGQNGVELRPGCPVHSFDRDGAKVASIHTGHGTLSAGQYLLTSGAWSEALLEPLGCRTGIRPVRGQIALLNSSPPLLQRVVEVGKRYLVPRPDGRVLVGSTEEDAGFEKRTTATAIEDLLHFARTFVPGVAAAAVERCWAGLRPGSPDGKPYLGKVPGLDNLFVAAGHYRVGIQQSCGTGQVMAELLLGKPTSVPLHAFRLDRAAAVTVA
jgi:glycine oxidase